MCGYFYSALDDDDVNLVRMERSAHRLQLYVASRHFTSSVSLAGCASLVGPVERVVLLASRTSHSVVVSQ